MYSIKQIALYFAAVLIAIFAISCSSGVEPSPDPGLVRIIMQANPADTIIIVGQDTVHSDPRDSISISIFQGRVYQDSIYSLLYQNREEYLQEDHFYNFFNRGEDGFYGEQIIFECLLPPEDFNRIVFGIDADFMLLTSGFSSGGIGIPMESSPELSLLKEFNVDFEIKSGKVTEIKIILHLFDSVVRFKDFFRFVPVMEVTSISDQGSF